MGNNLGSEILRQTYPTGNIECRQSATIEEIVAFFTQVRILLSVELI
jgi:hypothetical protein